MRFSKTEITLYFLTLLTLLLGIFLLPYLPDKMATHWNQFGVADGFSSKIVGILIMPIAFLVLAFIYSLVSRTDDIKKDQLLKKPLDKIIIAGGIFLLLIAILTLIWNLGYYFNMSYYIIPPMGLLFYLLGYLIIDVKQNYFFGIRNPWTLKSKISWQRTHFLSGILFMLLSLVLLFGIFYINYAFYLLLIGIIIIITITFIYSYKIYLKEKNNKIEPFSSKTIIKIKKIFFYLFLISIIIFLLILFIK